MRAAALASFDDETLQRMERSAWRESSRSWAEYATARDIEHRARPSKADDARALTQMLHDAAWSAENHWRGLHDERTSRARRDACADCGHHIDGHDLRAMDGCAGCEACRSAAS
jgi:RNA polymerase-binding transcription factor DksA